MMYISLRKHNEQKMIKNLLFVFFKKKKKDGYVNEKVED